MNAPTPSEHWLKLVAKLKVDRSRGAAQRKPLLLLAIASLTEEGILSEPVLLLIGGKN